MKNSPRILILMLCVTVQGFAQGNQDTSETKSARKKEFINPSKIVIPESVANDPRYDKLVRQINTEYNAPMDKGFYPIGLDGIQIKFDNKSLGLNCKDIDETPPVKTNRYPLSYSVIYQNHLVSLFEPGKFSCIRLTDMQHDEAFEALLNKRKFDYHWLVDGKLIATSGGVFFEFLNSTWVKYKRPFPLTNSPLLYQDQHYFCYSSCRGEFGGDLYFYNRTTGQTHVTESTCAVTVYQHDGVYYALSSLGHGFGFARLDKLNDPEKLPMQPTKVKLVDTLVKKQIFSYNGIQLFSSFTIGAQLYYIAYWQNSSVLVRIENNVIYIVDPLLPKEIYMHNAITTNYNGKVLITYSFYGESGEREAAAIIIDKGNFIRVNW